MRRIRFALCLSLFVVAAYSSSLAQQASTSGDTIIVPHLIHFAGVMMDPSGRPLRGIAGITFSLYRDQQGGAALWLETQNVALDANGRYEVLLGAESSEGMPMEVFTSGEARWLGVQAQGQGAEQPRVLLVSVPYALKAADAQTVGGLPASAFVLAAPPTATSASTITNNSTAVAPSGSAPPPPAPCSPLTSDGAAKANQITKFTTPCNLEGSKITDNGSTASVAELLSLPAKGTATAGRGENSQALNWTASVFNSGTSTAVPQNFRLQAGAVNNDTPNASGTLNLLFAQGTATPTETGFRIASNGQIRFAPGQTFPGAGTVTSVGSGAGLSGGPITTNGTLSIVSAGVTNAMLAHPSLKVAAGTDLTGGGSVALGSSTTLNLDTTKVPELAAANAFTNNNSISVSNNPPGLNVSNGTGDGADFTGGYDAAEFFGGAGGGIYADTHQDGDFTAAIYANEWGATKETFGVWGYSGSPTGAGVYGVGIAGSGQGIGNIYDPQGTGVWADAKDGEYAQALLASANDASAIFGINNSNFDSTLFLINRGSAGTGAAPVLSTAGKDGSCLIDTAGNLGCTGAKATIVPVEGGARKVALYGIHSAENWFEDVGSARLSKGEAVVKLESTFGETVNAAAEYHLFLTPNGDCKGLYVAQKGVTSFVVRELGGGTSDIAFDYRIIAKRRGYENVRLADKTVAFAPPAKLTRVMTQMKQPTPYQIAAKHKQMASAPQAVPLSQPRPAKSVRK